MQCWPSVIRFSLGLERKQGTQQQQKNKLISQKVHIKIVIGVWSHLSDSESENRESTAKFHWNMGKKRHLNASLVKCSQRTVQFSLKKDCSDLWKLNLLILSIGKRYIYILYVLKLYIYNVSVHVEVLACLIILLIHKKALE